MKIEKCKWKDGKKAPVMLMIDDYANKYMTDRDNGDYLGADWGGRCRENNSFINQIEDNLFSRFPYIKATLFLVVGARQKIIYNGKSSYSSSILGDEKFVKTLDELAHSDKYEIAYHGYNHGKIIDGSFVQEWMAFQSLEEAIELIEKGKEEYKKATGMEFKGGKYCGYQFNEFSDESIIKTGFNWWCRNYVGNYRLEEKDSLSLCEISRFGNVIDIPASVDGDLFSLKMLSKIATREYVKALYHYLIKKDKLETRLDQLVNNQLLISITEHTSPYREDSHIQIPNVITDTSNLIYIFNYLKKYDLWYATGSEIADYYNLQSNVSLYLEGNILQVVIENKKFENKKISIRLFEIAEEKIILENDSEKIIAQRNTRGYFVVNITTRYKKNVYKIKRI